MTARYLIVNADDANLSPGVNRGILAAHDQGIVTSTTVIVTREVPRAFVKALLARPQLGIGLHLNLTWGKPVSPPREIASLVSTEGLFRKRKSFRFVKPQHIERECRAQCLRFEAYFGKLPTHFDTHHHIHQDPRVFQVLIELAQSFQLPIRWTPRCTPRIRALFRTRGAELPTALLGRLEPHRHWRVNTLCETLAHLPAGINELMCHPAFIDAALEKRSSFVAGRSIELDALCHRRVKAMIASREIRLVNFRDLQSLR